MVKKLLSQVIAAGAGLFLAVKYVPEVAATLYPDSNFFGIPLTAQWQIFLILGIVLGFLNYFVKPILKLLALPLELITLGFFSIIISMAMTWIVDMMFRELYAPLILPLLYTTLIIWGINFVIQILLIRGK